MEIPPGIHGDEILSVKMARRLMNREALPVILHEDVYNGMGLLYYFIVGLFGKLMGSINIITAKWTSILVGSLEVVFVYLLIKELFYRRLAVITTLFLSIFFMQIFYSRMVLQWIWVPAFATIAFYFFIKALKTGKPLFYILSGLFLSMNLGNYSAAKAAPFVPIFFIIFLFLNNKTRQNIISEWRGILLMFTTLLLTFLPIIDYMIKYPHYYFKRMGHVSLLHGFPSTFDDFMTLFNNIIKNIQMFITESAVGYCHNLPSKPFFDFDTSLLFILGAGFLLTSWKKERSAFIILWLFFGLLPGFLSRLGPEDPYPARTVLAIPAVIITVSLGVEVIITRFESIYPKLLKFISPLIVLYFFIIFGFYNLRNYFILLPKDPHTMSYYRYTDKIIIDYMLKNQEKIIHFSPHFSSNLYFGMRKEFDDFRLKQFLIKTDFSQFELFKIYNTKNYDISLIGEGIYYRMFPVYKEYFPATKIDVVWDTNFWQFDKTSSIKYCYEWKYPDKTIDLNNEYEWFILYDPMVNFVRIVKAEISREDINNNFSLKAEFFKSNIKIGEKDISFPFICKEKDFNKIIITGLIDVPEYNRYKFMMEGMKGQLFIDGKEVKENYEIELYKGLHKIRIIISENIQNYFL